MAGQDSFRSPFLTLKPLHVCIISSIAKHAHFWPPTSKSPSPSSSTSSSQTSFSDFYIMFSHHQSLLLFHVLGALLVSGLAHLQLRHCDQWLIRQQAHTGEHATSNDSYQPPLQLQHLFISPLPIKTGQTHQIETSVVINRPLDRQKVVVRTSLFKVRCSVAEKLLSRIV